MPVVVGQKVDAVTALGEVSEMFTPVIVPAHGEAANMSAGSMIEIELSDDLRLHVDRDVDAEALRRMLAELGQ